MNHDADLHPEPPEFERHADVSAERLARVYAEALLRVADAAGQTSNVIEDIDSLVDDVLNKQPKLEALFAGAAVGRNARRAALEKAFAGQADSIFVKFLMVLNEHQRLDLLRPIRQAVHDLDNERHRRVKVHVYTAIPLPHDIAEQIAGAVRARFNMEPVLVPHVDPGLLGGLKIRIGDRQIDATVRTRLDNLRTEILARSSYEIQSRRDHFSSL
jgi:F-type H+-transporting ATPase subunit delta